MQNKFISFEGCDGSGKTTQVKKLVEYLHSLKQETIITREPGGCKEAEDIRHMLVTGDPEKWHSKTELLLMNASRHEHVKRTIVPALTDKKWVLCDRFYDSSLVYQGIAGSLDFTEAEYICKFASDNLEPDITILIDISAEVGLQRSNRATNKENRFEKKGIDYHNKVRNGYLQLAKTYSHRFITINGEQSQEDVFKDLLQALKDKDIV